MEPLAREKVLAAHRAGIRTVILPVTNEKDVSGSDDIPDTARNDLSFVYATNMAQIVSHALVIYES